VTCQTVKHALSVTSQVFFCSSPLRLDPLNKCSFGCTYCFARRRSRNNTPRGVRAASVAAIEARFDRVSSGVVQSALDEFLQRRIALQFGALQDPFSSFQGIEDVSLDLLRILKRHDYPTLISTKSGAWLQPRFLRILDGMNVVFRLSASSVPEQARKDVDIGCAPFAETIERIRTLARLGIPAMLRIQPVIPGFEDEAIRMTTLAADAGAKAVSFEYLKIPSEDLRGISTRLRVALRTDVWGHMQSMGTTRIGRDYVMRSQAKVDFLRAARAACRSEQVDFGAGDTEFIHYSDGGACCASAWKHLRNSQPFAANYVGVLQQQIGLGKRSASFGDLLRQWSPMGAVSTYLTTNSRTKSNDATLTDWQRLVAHRWNGGRSPYSPSMFFGVTKSAKTDCSGFAIYDLRPEL